jgi:hypothetical protein
MQDKDLSLLMLGLFLWESFENTCGRIKPILLEAKECSKTNSYKLDDTGANSDESVDVLVEISFGNH